MCTVYMIPAIYSRLTYTLWGLPQNSKPPTRNTVAVSQPDFCLVNEVVSRPEATRHTQIAPLLPLPPPTTFLIHSLLGPQFHSHYPAVLGV